MHSAELTVFGPTKLLHVLLRQHLRHHVVSLPTFSPPVDHIVLKTASTLLSVLLNAQNSVFGQRYRKYAL